ncbi:hypothetical protein LD646_06385 [Salmonella enterica]|nr:hypothetical protein [Salmonella enterica]MDJ6463489.1 hypothetical protein [Salmonella enterica]
MNNNKLTDEPMGLDAAIIHADERAASLSGPCAEQHAQLANWLRELQERRNATSEPIGYTDAEELRSDDNDIWMWKSPHGFGKDIPLYSAPPTPMVHDDLLSMAASAIEDILEHTDPGTSYYSCVWADVPGKLRAAMLQAGNSPATPDGWQLVPKEPTEAMNKAGWAAMNEHDAINPTYRAMLAAAPQQEVKSALEHGMQRYAGAMQKLSEGDK